MNTMKTKYHILFLLCMGYIPLFTSCDFLELGEYNYFDKQETTIEPARVSQLCTQVYTYLPNGLNGISGALQDAATDDAVHAYPTATVQRFVNGSWAPNYTVDDIYGNLYKGIHSANFYLENCLGLTFDDWKYSDGFADTYTSYLNYQYEVRFLRAYYYFELVRRYGNVPLLTKTIGIDEVNNILPATADEIFKFIIDECTEIAKHLPAKVTDLPGGPSNYQRVTSGTALALRARAALYYASPLFNSGNEISRWKAAAEAAHDIINQASTYGYRLESNYSNLFGATNNQSAEIIMCRPGGKSTAFEAGNFPIGVKGGKGNTCPTENLVSAYEMKDGTKFSWDNPAQASNPYRNRDPRMAMTIVCNGDRWPANTAVETFVGGRNGQPLANATLTGYYLRKYVNKGVSFEAGQTTNQYDHNWVLFRYAEVLLNYAEAAAHAFGPDNIPAGFTLSARDAVNQVRQRSSVRMPNFPAGMSTSDFLARLYNERRVEFAFEGHRFWDLRRWKALHEMKDIYKVCIEKNESGGFSYQREKLDTYNISDKMYFYPFANTELFKNKNLKQNPGWE
uniref:RagB/SusD family nutrient uptake outer membrane protein n=1 Tax=Prevotella sp. GTC17254 TaxID=3236794 RepID=A0AB33J593_9BACT